MVPTPGRPAPGATKGSGLTERERVHLALRDQARRGCEMIHSTLVSRV